MTPEQDKRFFESLKQHSFHHKLDFDDFLYEQAKCIFRIAHMNYYFTQCVPDWPNTSTTHQERLDHLGALLLKLEAIQHALHQFRATETLAKQDQAKDTTLQAQQQEFQRLAFEMINLFSPELDEDDYPKHEIQNLPNIFHLRMQEWDWDLHEVVQEKVKKRFLYGLSSIKYCYDQPEWPDDHPDEDQFFRNLTNDVGRRNSLKKMVDYIHTSQCELNSIQVYHNQNKELAFAIVNHHDKKKGGQV